MPSAISPFFLRHYFTPLSSFSSFLIDASFHTYFGDRFHFDIFMISSSAFIARFLLRWLLR
jgi:hypothetical protein